MGYRRSGVRWRDDVGWEVRCDSCRKRGRTNHYWPLTDEFWNKKWMTRCRACHLDQRRKKDHATYWANPEYRERKRQEAARYRIEAGAGIKVKKRLRHAIDARQSRIRYWDDPEAARAKARDYYWRHRDAILVKRRASYQKEAA